MPATSAWNVIESFVARLGEPNIEERLTLADWVALKKAMQEVAHSLATPETTRAERDRFRARLHELRLRISELERDLLKKREAIVTEQYQLQAAAAWNRATRL